MFTLGSLWLYMTARNGGKFRGGYVSCIKQRGFDVYRGDKCRFTEMVQSIIPPLTYESYKGQSGRIGIVGGCKEYTGAPYFAAISALKVGADLAHVFCTNAAAPVIKSYSPELIVHPILDDEKFESEMETWVGKMHALVIGPGLGRDKLLLDNTKILLEHAMKLNKPIVIDADGLFLLSENPDLIQGYQKAILTPNKVEFKKLFHAVVGEYPPAEDQPAGVIKLSKILGNVTIVCKGKMDLIFRGESGLICGDEGSPRRCGGQGDLLAGSLGVFSYWAHKFGSHSELFEADGPTVAAAYTACLLTRRCNAAAFRIHERSMTTSDMIEQIRTCFTRLSQ
ncbi:ATP-dependent (S)-NAD(P)H-hydrate dehydratase-like [Tubulanus polymorphus]|uniref:ATP-dependent (S)-NAD(P)H-hydrate dehydratase-like n=1 Tax=Tubulanus polymorphus TaxID=672921 RepID=UPI003DA55108